MHHLFFHLLVLSVSVVTAQDGFFKHPPAQTDEEQGRDWDRNLVWANGSLQMLQWNFNKPYDRYHIYLFQVLKQIGPSNISKGHELYEKKANQSAQNYFNWYANPEVFGLGTSDVFFFQLIQNISEPTKRHFRSHYFNISLSPSSDPPTRPRPSSSSSISSVPTGTPTTTIQAEESKSGTDPAIVLGLELGLGLGLGTSVLVILAVLTAYYIRRHRSAALPVETQQPTQQEHPYDPKWQWVDPAPRYSAVVQQQQHQQHHLHPVPPVELESPDPNRRSELF